MEQGFDFNRWVKDGVSYLAAGERDMLRSRLASAASGHDERPGISVHKPDDVQFVAELLAQVKAWLEVRRGGRRRIGVNLVKCSCHLFLCIVLCIIMCY